MARLSRIKKYYFIDAFNRKFAMTKTKLITICLLVAVTAACNSGSDSNTSANVENTAANTASTFPYAKAQADYITNGGKATYVVSGTLANGSKASGFVTDTYSNAAPSKFNGNATLAVKINRTGGITANGITAPTTGIRTAHYNPSSYMLLGFDGGPGDFNVVTSGYQSMPKEVKVGDSAIEGTFDTYTSADMSIKVATCEQKFIVEPLTSVSILVNETTSCKSALTGDISVDQMRVSIDKNGALKIVSLVTSSKDGTLTFTAQ